MTDAESVSELASQKSASQELLAQEPAAQKTTVKKRMAKAKSAQEVPVQQEAIETSFEKELPEPVLKKPRSYGVIIKREAAESWKNAAQAFEVMQQKNAELDAKQQEIFEAEGQRGFELGTKQGIAAGEQHIADRLITLTKGYEEETARLNAAFPDMVMDCVSRIVGTIKPTEAIRKILTQAIKGMSSTAGFALKIPPDMKPDIFSDIIDQHHAAGNPKINIEVDETLAPLQTQLVSRHGVINLGIEEQLRNLRLILGATPDLGSQKNE